MSWWRLWALTSTGAAVLATALDAALLQRARSYFTGGFLAADSVRSVPEGAAFIGGSLLADIGVAGALTGIVLWAAGRAGVRTSIAVVLAVMAALAPVAIADFVEYELATYLGDAFDLRLMFDLVGGDPREVFAVSSAHVTTILLVCALILLAALWLVAAGRRRGPAGGSRPQPPSLAKSATTVVLLLIVAGIGTTALRRSSDVLDNGLRRKPSGQFLGGLVNRLSDVDGDGFGLLGRPPDRNLLDARVRPYAQDIPGNGVDEDGVAGDLPAGAPPYEEPPVSASPWISRPDVILVVLESFRADAVGERIDGKAVTPVIDELARRGVSAQAAYSHNGYTVQARHHIFAGSVADVRGGTSLVDDFKAHGYETAYFSGQDESFGGAAYGVGFDRADVAYDARVDRDQRYTTFSTAGSLAVPHGLLVDRITSFLERRDRSRPLFLYVNFHDTHFPYHHRGIDALVNGTPLAQADISPDRRASLRATYLNTAANVDRAIGRVLDQARRHLMREPGVVVVSDHGESLFDEGFLGHGYALNDAQTRIPLVVANLPMKLVEPVGQADLRDALHAALESPAGGAPPQIVRDDTRHVFQYLGAIDRPAQIAFTGLRSQVIYDFRSERVRVDKGEWVAPSTLPPQAAARWRELVTTWERMIIARGDRRRRDS